MGICIYLGGASTGNPKFPFVKRFFDRLEEVKMKKHKRLSIEELRNFPGFKKHTDEEAEREIKILKTLSILFYELFMKAKMNEKNVKHLKTEDHETEFRNAA